MKIAVNTRLLLTGKLEGIGWFTYQGLKRIVRAHPEVKFYFIFDRPFCPSFIFAGNVHPVRLRPPARHPLLYYLYFEYALAGYLKRLQPDLFVSPDGFLSCRYQGKQLPVFHDLNFMHHPEYVPRLTASYYKYFFPKYAAKASRIATVSDFSKNDIVRTFGYPAEKVDVVYNGVNEGFAPVDQAASEEIKRRHTEGRPYFVYIGALHKRKNIDHMLLAFDRFRGRDQEGHKLVVIGAPMFGSGDIERVFQSMVYKDDVIMAGRLYGEELRALVASARALLLVSHFEGFGIPIIEAMKCEVPVIASNVTSMPEVAGGAALLVNPSSVDEIANAMQEIAGNKALREQLVALGKVRALDFSWDKTAGLLWDSMMMCV